MKYIRMMDDITLKSLENEPIRDENGEEIKFSLKKFILHRLLDPKFANGMEAVVSSFQIKQALEKCNDSDKYLALETKDWERLSDATKNPSPQTTYNPAYSWNLVPFMKAVISASDNEEE